MPEISESMVINRVFYDKYGSGLLLFAQNRGIPPENIKFAQNGGRYEWGVGHTEGLVHITYRGAESSMWGGAKSLCGTDTQYHTWRYNYNSEPQNIERMCPRCLQRLRGFMRKHGIKVSP